MTDNEIMRRVNEALAAEFELDIDDMVPEASFKDNLGLDSLDAVDMVIVLEQEFGFKIGKDPKIAEIRKLSDLYSYVIDKRNALAG